MIYLYGFADQETPGLREIQGLDDAPLEGVTRGEVTAVFSVHRQLPVRPEVASLRRHDEVVTALMGRATVAPARFGSVLTDVPRLQEVLADEARRLTPVLRRLRGKRELSVRATIPNAGDRDPASGKGAGRAPVGSGRAYLLGLARDRMAVAEPSFARVHQTLAARAQAWSVREGPDCSMVGAYLVSVDDIESFREDLVAARAREPHLRVSLTGPWAAYSFVDAEDLVDA